MITMHPGEYLAMAYVEPLNLVQRELAENLGVSKSAVSRLLAEKADLSPEMAVRLSMVFDRSAESWMLMQTKHSLNLARTSVDPKTIRKITMKPDDAMPHQASA